MEKKTIGTFIAVLRKSKGLTQRQLAEALGVSDKSISRWERDESAPDLSLIPVIAEFFEVTADELLRGQRGAVAPSPAKQEKRLARILAQIRLQFRIRTVLILTCAFVGLAASLLGAVYNSTLGYLLGMLCHLAAGIGLAICIMLSSTQLDTEDFDTAQTNVLRQNIQDSGWTTGSILAALAACSALLLNQSLYSGEFLLLSLPLASAILFVSILLQWFVCLPRRENAALHELRRSTAGTIAAAYAAGGLFLLFFWLALEWEAILVLLLLYLPATLAVWLGIYWHCKRQLSQTTTAE